jgi:hypothetical protein
MRKGKNQKIVVTLEIVVASVPGMPDMCVLAGAITAAFPGLTGLKVGFHMSDGVMIPNATWYFKHLGGKQDLYKADISPREEAMSMIVLNDAYKQEMIDNWTGDKEFTLINIEIDGKQDNGGVRDDTDRKKVRSHIRLNPGQTDIQVSEAIGCSLEKVVDTRKRMRPGPVLPRAPRRPRPPEKVQKRVTIGA